MSLPRWNEVTAVYGGTFDPPHLGHREVVRGLFRLPGVKQVRVIPAAAPPHKANFTAAEHRVAMTRLCFGARSGDETYPTAAIQIDLRELDRASRTARPSYSHETLLELKAETAELAFVIGADQLRDLHQWYRFPGLLDACHWIVLERKPAGGDLARATLQQWVSSGLARPEKDFWRLRGGTLLTVVPTDAPAVSSTAVRETIGRTGEIPSGTLLPEICAYLMRHRLYGTDPAKAEKKDRI